MARISIENDDLVNMPSIIVSGVEGRAFVYKKAESKTVRKKPHGAECCPQTIELALPLFYICLPAQ
jgi:hypothetical protein